jgi:hypothetical protein
MQTAPSANGFASVGVNFGMTIFCIFPTWVVLSELEQSHEIQRDLEVRAEEIDK